MARLGGALVQRPPPGGHIEEEVLHRELAAGGSHHGFLRLEPAPLHHDLHAELVLPATRGKLHMRNGRDGGQRFAPEAERMESIDILYARYLARGMFVERHPRIQRRHALPVVDHPDKLLPPVAVTHGHGRGTGIHGVLHHLLDHRCGTVHHLPGRDLTGDGIGQQSYLV